MTAPPFPVAKPRTSGEALLRRSGAYLNEEKRDSTESKKLTAEAERLLGKPCESRDDFRAAVGVLGKLGTAQAKELLYLNEREFSPLPKAVGTIEWGLTFLDDLKKELVALRHEVLRGAPEHKENYSLIIELGQSNMRELGRHTEGLNDSVTAFWIVGIQLPFLYRETVELLELCMVVRRMYDHWQSTPDFFGETLKELEYKLDWLAKGMHR